MIANELVMDDDNFAFLATIRHVLVESTNFNDTRNKYFVASSIEELFRSVLDFIKETHFYDKLWC